MIDDIVIVDDLIPFSMQEDIKNLMFSAEFPWYFSNDVTYGADEISEKRPACWHLLCKGSEVTSGFYSHFSTIAHMGASKVNYNMRGIYQGRCFMQFPLNLKSYKPDSLHVDTYKDHLVVLYYVCDSDGDTLIVDKKCEDKENASIQNDVKLNVEDYEIIARVTPKQGRAVIFSGDYYHTAQQPRNGMRSIINWNVV